MTHPEHKAQPSALPSKPYLSSSVATRRLTGIMNHVNGNGAHHTMAATPSTAFTAVHVPQAPEDPLFGLMAAYRKDTFEKKVDLGIGAYRDDNAKPWVLPVVHKVGPAPAPAKHHLRSDRTCLQADERLRKDPNLNHEYLPIAGLADFTSAAQKLMLGADSPAIAENRVRDL